MRTDGSDVEWIISDGSLSLLFFCGFHFLINRGGVHLVRDSNSGIIWLQYVFDSKLCMICFDSLCRYFVFDSNEG